MKRAFVDTETNGLHAGRRAWEIGAIIAEDGKPARELQWVVRAADLDLGNADLQALNIGRFYQRHPEFAFMDAASNTTMITRMEQEERAVMQHLEYVTRGAHIIGINPHFDLELLAVRMRANGYLPAWHYSPDCVKTLARGYLAAKGRPMPPDTRSDDLFTALGIDLSAFERHTALGDAKLTYAVWRHVMGETPQHAVPAGALA